MPYIKSDRPVGRPRKYLSRADEPARLSLRISHELSHQLKATAHQQQTSVAAVVTQVLAHYLGSASHFETLDTALTATAKALEHLEAALTPDNPLMAYVNALYESLTPIADVLMTLHPEENAS